MRPDPRGFIAEKMNSLNPPTNIPHFIPRVKPARKTTTVINSTLGISMRAYPKATARAANIAALTRFVRLS